jgi:hypothetical protein
MTDTAFETWFVETYQSRFPHSETLDPQALSLLLSYVAGRKEVANALFRVVQEAADRKGVVNVVGYLINTSRRLTPEQVLQASEQYQRSPAYPKDPTQAAMRLARQVVRRGTA